RVCHREVELNRRLAPDAYLGVADVVGPDGEVCEHMVVMRRMPPERRLSTLVAEGRPVEGALWDLAHLIAAFHARAERSEAADAAASPGALAGRWTDNTAELRRHPDVVDPQAVERVQTLAMRYLAGRHPLFEARLAEGRAVDGHGDLLADDVFLLDEGPQAVERVQTLAMRYRAGRHPLFEARLAEGRAVDGHGDLLADDVFLLDEGPQVLDCIEFDDQLRYGDTLADVAFLAMDLERLGRPDLADHFLRAYREHADDAWPASLQHHHVASRAQVRAKVRAIRAAQGHEEAADEARRLLALALRHLEAGRVRLVLV